MSNLTRKKPLPKKPKGNPKPKAKKPRKKRKKHPQDG